MLDHFFVTHDAIKQNLQQLGSAASESVNKERTKVKGFAAYKENSTPLSSVEEEKNKECFIRSGSYESCFDVWFKATLFVFILMLNPFSLKYFFLIFKFFFLKS